MENVQLSKSGSESVKEDMEEEEEWHFNDIYALNCLIGFICATGQMILIIWPYWIQTDQNSSSQLLGNVHIFKGFWTKCLTRHVSQWQCSYYEYEGAFKFKSIEGLKLMAVSSVGLAWVGWTMSFYGGQFMKVTANEYAKSIMVIVAGVCGWVNLVTWLTTLALVGSIVSQEYEQEISFDRASTTTFSDDDFKFRQGVCFYIGIAVSLLLLVNAGLYTAEGITRLKDAKEETLEEGSERSLISTNVPNKPLKHSSRIPSKQKTYSPKQFELDDSDEDEDPNLWI